MKRREFLGLASKGALGVTALGLAGCTTPGQLQQAVSDDPSLPTINWQMATSWPLSLDTIFGGAQVVAARVAAMTNGKFTIEPRAAGELAPGLQVLDVVQEGAVPIGHTASYYYVGKGMVTAFGTSVPFGLTSRQQDAWLYEMGGLEMMQEIYAQRFGVIQFPAGNTGVQMGGWFNRELRTAADLQGLKVRIPGLGGQALDRLGALIQVLPGGEIFQALQTGAIDGAEWVGPYDDEKLGFHQAARFYYYPGWWEPGPTLEIQINLNEWNSLPQEYQEILKTAAFEANMIMMARYDAKNPEAMDRLIANPNVEVLPFPDEIMAASEAVSFEMYDEFSAEDPDFKSVYEAWNPYRESVQRWHRMAEVAMMTHGNGM